MDKKTIIATIVSVSVTMMVTLTVGWVVGVFEKGVNASERELIIKVIEEELKTPDGKSHAAALQAIDRNLTTINTKVSGIESNISEIRTALLTLAEG
jgi:hypothetical protein